MLFASTILVFLIKEFFNENDFVNLLENDKWTLKNISKWKESV